MIRFCQKELHDPCGSGESGDRHRAFTNADIAEFYKVPVNAENFFMEAHAKLRPVDFASDGLFVCGLAHYPKSLDESIAQAKAAAGRAVTVLRRETPSQYPRGLRSTGICASVAGVCIEVCPFGALIQEEGPLPGLRAEINSGALQGLRSVCGLMPFRGHKSEGISRQIRSWQ